MRRAMLLRRPPPRNQLKILRVAPAGRPARKLQAAGATMGAFAGATPGTTTPQVMIIFMAASTHISGAMIFRRGTNTHDPAVAFRATETYTAACGSPSLSLTSGTSSAVMKPMLQAPGRGYSIMTTLRKELDCENTLSVKLLTPPYTVRTTGMWLTNSSPQTT